MVEQQLFTKVEKGLIKNTPGLDTVAKSSGLEANYITNYINQYCRYHIPDQNMLGGSKLPKIKTYASMLNSDLLIGQSVFRQIDGDKSFLTHNYVLKKGSSQWEEFVKDVSNLVYADAFVEEYDKNLAPECQQLDVVPVSKKATFSGRAKTFAKNKIRTSDFRLLLGAVFYALEKRKKIFISLKGSVSETEHEALEVMKYIFGALPYEIRRKLGYSTFFYDGDVVPGVEVYFVYNGMMPQSGNVIALGKHSASKDYIFDFEHENILHIDFAELDKSEYLASVMEYIDRLEKLEGFYSFAENASCHLPEARRISLRLYDDLTLLYNVSQMNNEEMFSFGNRMVIALGDMLTGSEENSEFLAVYETFLDKYTEATVQENIPLSNEILKRLVAQYEMVSGTLREKITALILTDLELCLSNEDSEDVFTHINIAAACPVLYKLLVEDKIIAVPALLSTYMQHMFNQHKTVHALFEYADSMLETLPKILRMDDIRQMFYDKVLELYDAAGDRYIALKYINDRCQTLKEKYPDLAETFTSLSEYTTNQFMKNISIASFSTDHIFDFTLPNAELLDEEGMLKYNTILALKEVLMLTQDPTMAFVHYDAFGFENISKNLSADETAAAKAEKEIKQRLWNAIRDRKTSSKRSIYPVLLYGSETKEPALRYDFTKIFRYLDETLHYDVADFINWFMTGNLYIVPQDGDRLVVDRETVDTGILEDFYKACLEFYRTSKGAMLRDSRYLQKLRKSLNASKNKHPMFREVLESFNKDFDVVVNQNVSVIAKLSHWLKTANKKPFILALILIVVAASGIIIAKKIASNPDNEVPAASTLRGQLENTGRQAVTKSAWSASKILKNNGTESAAKLIGEDKTQKERFDLGADKSIVIDFSGSLTINGLSICYVNKPENIQQVFELSVDTGDNKKIKMRETQTVEGITYYEFEKATPVSKVTIDNITTDQSGVIELSDFNGYVYR